MKREGEKAGEMGGGVELEGKSRAKEREVEKSGER